jgi:hypothetical protein
LMPAGQQAFPPLKNEIEVQVVAGVPAIRNEIL